MYEICPTFFLRSCQLQQTLWVLLLIYFQLFGGQSKTSPPGSSFLASCCDMKAPSCPPVLPADPLLLTASHPSPCCHRNNYQLLLLPAPSCSSFKFRMAMHHPGVLSPAMVSKRNGHVGENTSIGLGRHLLVSDPFWLQHKQ